MSRRETHDLTWEDAQVAAYGPILRKLEYKRDSGDRQTSSSLWAITQDGSRHNVVEVLTEAISEGTQFLDEKGI